MYKIVIKKDTKNKKYSILLKKGIRQSIDNSVLGTLYNSNYYNGNISYKTVANKYKIEELTKENIEKLDKFKIIRPSIFDNFLVQCNKDVATEDWTVEMWNYEYDKKLELEIKENE